MTGRWRLIVGVIVVLAGVVVWAVSLAIYQPMMEPTGFWTDPTSGRQWPHLASNNTYWPRDISQLGMLLALAGLILLGNATLRSIAVGAGATLAWLGADLWLDRMDVSGTGTAVLLGAGALVALAAVAVPLARYGTGRLSPDAPRFLVAGTTAVLAAGTALVMSPWEDPRSPEQARVEIALAVIKAVLVVLFAATAIGLIADRIAVARTVRVAVLVVVGAVLVWASVGRYETSFWIGVLGMLAAAVLVVGAAHEASLVRLILAGLCAGLTFIVGLSPVFIVGIAAGNAMTDLAGNPAVNGADTDLSYATAILAYGLALSAASYFVTVVAARKPARLTTTAA